MIDGAAAVTQRGREPKSARVIVVLPAYNEEQNIGRLLDSIDTAMQDEQLPYQVLVVEDGSRDGTLRVLESYLDRVPLRIHRHEVNQGLGITIRDGLQIAAQIADDADIVVTMDADETHPPGLIFRMVHMIREGHDVVIASRYRPGARVFGVSAFRQLMSIGASMLFRIAFPTRGVRDYTCGYRAYRGRVLRKAVATYGDKFVAVTGFQCMIDILLKLRALNVIFGEVPMVLRYDLKQGESKMRIARTVRQSLALLVRRRFGGR